MPASRSGEEEQTPPRGPLVFGIPSPTMRLDAESSASPLRGSRPAERDPRQLLAAAESGDRSDVRAQVLAGVDVDAVDGRRRTAILLAAAGGHLEIVRALIDAGADIDRQDRTCLNPFLLGCITGDVALVRLMVSAGADLERLTRFGGNGITPASEKGHLEVVEE